MHSTITSQLFICCKTWIAHVLHANERKIEDGAEKERSSTWLEEAWLLSSAVAKTMAGPGGATSFLLCFSPAPLLRLSSSFLSFPSSLSFFFPFVRPSCSPSSFFCSFFFAFFLCFFFLLSLSYSIFIFLFSILLFLSLSSFFRHLVSPFSPVFIR